MSARRRPHRTAPLVGVALAGALILAACSSPGAKSSGSINTAPRDTSSGTLSILDYPNIWEGFTKASASGASAISSWYTYYHDVWEHYLPNTVINESTVPNETSEVERTILGVSSGNPPDLIGVGTQLPVLVQKGALMNLDPYFKAYGLSPSDFLPALSRYARYNGSWYAMPAVNLPTMEDVMFVPSYVAAAGLNPSSPPRTFAAMFAMTKKVTKFSPSGALERIGFDLVLPSGEAADPGLTAGAAGAFQEEAGLFCDNPGITWSSKTGYNFTSPCFERFVKYLQTVIDFYGGYNNYLKFMAGDPGPWSCSPNDYFNKGKILYAISAFWAGIQSDRCYPTQYEFSYAPTGTGTMSSLSAVESTAWMLAIPKGAPDPGLAFKFWYDTLYLNAQLDGPTTNGYLSARQEKPWIQNLVSVESKVRTQKGFPGNPITSYENILGTEGALANFAFPQSPVTAQYDQAATTAVNAVLYHQKSITAAMQSAQSYIEGVERSAGVPS